jgi:midasin
MLEPVKAVQARLDALLAEWPDHPLLTQLAGICARVLSLPLAAPLKQALTGVELLLARAQAGRPWGCWEPGGAQGLGGGGGGGGAAGGTLAWPMGAGAVGECL